jgi:hypothetical protein
VKTLENRVREATRAVGETVPASSVPPLRLPEASSSFASFAGSARWRRWLAPAAAAAAVIVVAAVLVAVRGSVGPGKGTSPSASGGAFVPQYTSVDGVPPYYVALTASKNPYYVPSYAVIRNTLTGATLGTVRASVPGDTISAVTAAADDRTFVLAEDKWVGNNSTFDQYYEPRSFYLLRLNADGKPASLTRLPMTGGPLVTGMALSPDGTMLAIGDQPRPTRAFRPPVPRTQLHVYTLATGAVRTWYAYGTIGGPPDDPESISWTGNGQQLLFDWDGSRTDGQQEGPWLLNLAAGGTSLLADSRQVISTYNPGVRQEPPGCEDDQIVTPDGSAVICPTANLYDQNITPSMEHMEIKFLEYSTATGHLVRTLALNVKDATEIPEANVLWSNAAGTVLIAAIPNIGIGWVGIIRGNTFMPIPMPPNEHPYYLGAW